MKKDNNSFMIRLVVCLSLAGYLILSLLIYHEGITSIHYLMLIILLIVAISDRFSYIKIPGFAELKKEVNSTTKEIIVAKKEIIEKISQTQTQSIVNYVTPTTSMPNPPDQSLTQPEVELSGTDDKQKTVTESKST